MKRLLSICVLGAAAAVLIGCNGGTGTNAKTGGTATQGGKDLTGEIKIDGSSTVYLITEAVAANFKKTHPKVNTTVGISGTGGGFKKFYNGETDIQDASRAIKPPEVEKCKENKIDYVELQVAWDGLAVIINPENTWAKNMTVAQLRKMWHPEGQQTIKKWKDIDPTWPDEEMKLYGAGPDSGTFDYFTEVINGKEKECRTDYQGSEDDHNIIKGVEGNKFACGFLGVAYYEQHKAKLGVVAVAEKEGAPFVLPTKENVLAGKYKPLGRPLFIYVKLPSLKRPEIQEFARFYLRRDDLVESVKYVKMDAVQQAESNKRLEDAIKKAAQ